MYLAILALPMFGSAVAGLRGRSIGVTGAHIITTGCLMTSAALAIVAFYEVGLSGSPVSIVIGTWIDSEFMLVQWGFLFDSLTVSMLLPVLVVSSLVHLYSISYMAEDPHNQRFFSYLSMFTFFMLVLVTGDNYLILFIGWEGIGISSYLLINFWYTRMQANKAGMKALTVNRVGDMFLSVGFFAIFWVFGNVDYASVFSVAPYINETAITIIGLLLLIGAMAKSANIPLHTWLPDAMEGWANTFKLVIVTTLIILFILVTSSSEIILPDVCQSALPPILASMSRKDLETITGNMLGDGSIRFPNLRRDGEARGNARYEMTMSAKVYAYLQSLYDTTYAQFSGQTGLLPYPNVSLPQHLGKVVTQFYFCTRMLPIFTALHSIWHQLNGNSFIKIIPLLVKCSLLFHWHTGLWKMVISIITDDLKLFFFVQNALQWQNASYYNKCLKTWVSSHH